jgi:hypothetical protein
LKATLNKNTILIGVTIGLVIILGIFGIPFLYNEYVATTPTYTLPFADENGNPLHITNNRSAINPTFDQVLAFLQQDDTNALALKDTNVGPGLWVVRLHDNAEKAGIRAGVVELKLPDEANVYSLDVFDTVDKGRIMVNPVGNPYVTSSWAIVHMDNNDLHTMMFIPIQNRSVTYLADTGNITGVGAFTGIKANIVGYTW